MVCCGARTGSRYNGFGCVKRECKVTQHYRGQAHFNTSALDKCLHQSCSLMGLDNLAHGDIGGCTMERYLARALSDVGLTGSKSRVKDSRSKFTVVSNLLPGCGCQIVTVSHVSTNPCSYQIHSNVPTPKMLVHAGFDTRRTASPDSIAATLIACVRRPSSCDA